MSNRETWQTTVSQWSVGILGIVLFAAVGGQILGGGQSRIDLFEVSLPLLIAIGVVFGGVWLRDTCPAQRTAHLALWTVGGAIVGIAVSIWFTFIIPLEYTSAGGPFVLSVNGAAIFMAAGLLLGYYATGFRQREQKLLSSESRFRALTENSSFAVITIDETSTIRYTNDAVEDLFGYSSAELVGEPLSLLIPERLRDAYRDGFDRYLTEGTCNLDWENTEHTGLHTDGEEFPIEISFGEYAVDDNRLFTGVIHDVTGHKQAEERLQAHTTKVTQLHGIATAIATTDTKAAIYQRTADGAADLFSCDVARVSVADGGRLDPVASSIDEPVDAYDALPATLGYAGQAYQSGEIVRIDDLTDTRSVAVPEGSPLGEPPDHLGAGFEGGQMHSNNDPRDVYRALLTIPLAEYGVLQLLTTEPNGFDVRDEEIAELLASHVNTALKRVGAEATIRRERDRLGEFASMVTHDLRNPLNVAQGRLQLVRETGNLEHLADIGMAHDRIQRIIEDMLTLARQGEVVGEIKPVSFDGVAREAWITVETDEATIQLDSFGHVEADRSGLRQVFENLYRNAIEHGGENVTVTVGQSNRGFYIEDTGPGIPSDARDKIFESGYSTSTDGTGLGLTIVKRIVEAHDWNIDVTEGTEGGARFDISGVKFSER